MRLGSAWHHDRPVVVAAAEDAIVDVTPIAEAADLGAVLEAGRLDVLLAKGVDGLEQLPAGELTWRPPVPHPTRILCAGFNFASHAGEMARELPDHPTFFVRFASSCVGHEEPIVRPQVSDSLDWEGEVAVVIGSGGHRIPKARALDHVAGYTPFADNSVREWQLHSTQATAGKNFDRTGSFGPWMVTADEVPAPEALSVRTLLDGVEMQHGHLSDLVFGVDDLIAYASTFTTLSPGDVIATGTPPGVGMRQTPPRYLRAGEQLIVELVGFTRLVNAVVDESAE